MRLALTQMVWTDVRAGHEVANHMMDDVASWTLSKVNNVVFLPSSSFLDCPFRTGATFRS